MKSPNDLLTQLIENARNEGRQEIRDAVLAALGADKLWSSGAANGAAKNGRAQYGSVRDTIVEAVRGRPGLTAAEIGKATGLSGNRLHTSISNALTAERITRKGLRGSFRYYPKRGA